MTRATSALSRMTTTSLLFRRRGSSSIAYWHRFPSSNGSRPTGTQQTPLRTTRFRSRIALLARGQATWSNCRPSQVLQLPPARLRLTSGHGWNVLLCEQMFKSPGEPQIRTSSRQYFCDAMLLRTTPMPDPALHSPPNAAGRFSVTHWKCRVVFVQDRQGLAQEWHGNDKPPHRSFGWSPRPPMKPLRALLAPATPTPASPISSGNSPGRLRAISSNRRRPDWRAAASQTEVSA